METTLEDLSVELFYEIFIYFHLHEIRNTFSNLNSRITSIIENLPWTSIYLGFCGMSIEISNFYYKYLSQTNIATRLTSLCVSDILSIDNGLWFAEHGSPLINLRHLSLIDIKRASFEMILDSLSPINSLIFFSIHFSNYDRAACTFIDVPEGAYHERIFRLFPSLRICHVHFLRFAHKRIASPFVLPPNKCFMPVQNSPLNLRSLTLGDCSPSFLSHLVEHLPQLEQLSCGLYHTSWVPEEHPLRYDCNNPFAPINKRLAPNLRRLRMDWIEMAVDLQSMEELFEDDVLFSLTNFTLLGGVADLKTLHNILSKLSSQCLYRYDVKCYVKGALLSSDASNTLSSAFEQLKGSVPIDLELFLRYNDYSIRARTLPRIETHRYIDIYLNNDVVQGQSRWPYNKHPSNSQWLGCNSITMSYRSHCINDDFLFLSSDLVRWDRITSIEITQPFNITHPCALFSQTINLRSLTLDYSIEYGYLGPSEVETSIELIHDESLCNILMCNGLRQLNLLIYHEQSNLINLACLIVERLPHLQVTELQGIVDEIIDMIVIFINGLSELSFITFRGGLGDSPFHENKIRTLCSSNTRFFRVELSENNEKDTLYIWL